MINNLPDAVYSIIESINYDDIFVIDGMNEKKYSYRQIFSYALDMDFCSSTCNEYMVVLDNNIELFVYLFAAMLHNQVIIPVDPEKKPGEVQFIQNIHPHAVYIDFCHLPECVTLLSDEKILQAFKNIDYHKDFLITYTSGSTGEPKGVVHSAYNLFYSALVFGKQLGYNKETKMCHTMPMTYMAGILNTIILPFIMKGQIVLFERFHVKNVMKFWKNVIKYEVNTFWLSPTMLHLIMKIDKGETVKKYLHSVGARFSVGTAPLTKELRREFEEKYQVSIFQSYGLSETLFISSADDQHLSAGSVGRVLDDVNLEFEESGEILIDVPWMMKRYENADTLQFYKDGKYISGDLGEIRYGELYITGRVKDLIIKGGLNIRPADIEEVIRSLDGIEEVAVLSFHKDNEERIACCYSGKKINGTIANGRIIEKLGKAYKVDKFLNVDMLPYNLNGKIDKMKIGELLKNAD